MSQYQGQAARAARRQGVVRHYVRGSLMILGSFAGAAVLLAFIA
jgi:hypothetical protein